MDGQVYAGMNLPTKTVFITGGSEGIGLAFAKALLEAKGSHGASHGQFQSVVLIGRSQAKLAEAKQALNDSCVTTLSLDLSTEQGLFELGKAMSRTTVAGLINNAAFGMLGDFEKLTLHKQREMLDLNVWAPVALSHAFMNSSRVPGAFLIQVSSGLGFIPLPHQAVYSATKAFINSLSESLEFRARALDIQLVNVCPGVTKTRFRHKAGGLHEFPEDRWSMTADEVATECLKFMQKGGKGVLIPGRYNRFMLKFAHFLPRSQILHYMSKVAR